MGLLKAFVQLTRLEHAVMLSLAVIIGQAIAIKGVPPLDILAIAALSPFFIEIGSFAINDYWDLDTDLKNRRKDRPLVRRELSPEFALFVSIFSFPVGIILAYFVNWLAFGIALIFSLLAILYSYSLKKTAVAGNAVIALSMAIPFIFGNMSVTYRVSYAVVVLSLMAFLMGFGREIAGSIRDIKGDIAQGRRTLPYAIGAKKSGYVAVLSILAAVALSPALYLADAAYRDVFYIALVGLTDLLLLWSSYLVLSQGNLRLVRNLTLASIGTGLLGFLLSTLL